MYMPVSGVYKIKGAVYVFTVRVEHGIIKKDDQVLFLQTHYTTIPCHGKALSVEMHQKSMPSTSSGDNVKGLRKFNISRVGDVMILQKDTTLNRCETFTVQVTILDHPGQLK